MAFKINNVDVVAANTGTFANISTTNLITNQFDNTLTTGLLIGGIPLGSIISTFPFAVDSNATKISNEIFSLQDGAGCSSRTHAYVAGGFPQPALPPNPALRPSLLRKFSFGKDDVGNTIGNLAQPATALQRGLSSLVEDKGYVSGGRIGPSGPYINNIESFPFATDTNATDYGDLTQVRSRSATQSSPTNGYTSGGFSGPPSYSNVIDKFPFASAANASDVGDLTEGKYGASGHASETNGYTAGGITPASPVNLYSVVIEKFPFATDTNSSDIGQLSSSPQSYASSSVSSSTDGYSVTSMIQKFPFATDTNGTYTGFTEHGRAATGHQY